MKKLNRLLTFAMISTCFTNINAMDISKIMDINKIIESCAISSARALVDTTEPKILAQAGFSQSEIHNRMLGERMFALSVAWFVCPPVIIVPIACSLYEIAQPSPDDSYQSLGKKFIASQAIDYTINSIKK